MESGSTQVQSKKLNSWIIQKKEKFSLKFFTGYLKAEKPTKERLGENERWFDEMLKGRVPLKAEEPTEETKKENEEKRKKLLEGRI